MRSVPENRSPGDQLVVILPLSRGLDLTHQGQIFCSCPGRWREELMIFNPGYQPRIIYLSKRFRYKSVLLGPLSPRLLAFLGGRWSDNFCKGRRGQLHLQNSKVKRKRDAMLNTSSLPLQTNKYPWTFVSTGSNPEF